MARLSDEELNEIVERDLPGHRVVRRKGEDAGADADPARLDVDEVSPDLAELREKYLGDASPDAVPEDLGENTDDEIVIVESTDPADPLDHGSRPKAVVVSGKDRKIIGYQG
jgi:hypothetical protein